MGNRGALRVYSVFFFFASRFMSLSCGTLQQLQSATDIRTECINLIKMAGMHLTMPGVEWDADSFKVVQLQKEDTYKETLCKDHEELWMHFTQAEGARGLMIGIFHPPSLRRSSPIRGS